jgi:hypothetical protein
MKYRGIVGPLLTSLRAGTGPKPNRLVGQEVKTSRDDVSVFVALDSDQNAHLVVSPAPASDERLRRFALKTFGITVNDWFVGSSSAQRYLDIRCVVSGNEALLRPFEAFCDDFLVDLEDGTPTPEAAVLRTAQRWHAFWARQGAELSQQAMRGLLGELTFLERLIEQHGSSAVRSWTGPEQNDHDFQSGSEVAFEVKTSNRIPYQIECNLNQLDRGLFSKLYLVCFRIGGAQTGISLPEQVERVASALQDDAAALLLFEERLAMAGYSRANESDYVPHRFEVGIPEVFVVDADFPAITLKGFVKPPDMRVLDVRYTLEVTGMSAVPLDDAAMNTDLQRLCS